MMRKYSILHAHASKHTMLNSTATNAWFIII
jgi:hypothetical protein